MEPRTQGIHGTYPGDPLTGATAVPIYQTAAYLRRSAEEMEDVFAGRAPGDVYSRISNPTNRVLESRLAEMECDLAGGPAAGCIVTSSGMAAISATMLGLLSAGDHIVSASGIFGGTYSLFTNTLGRFGVTTTFVASDAPDDFAAAIRPNTRVVFLESVGNPRMNVPDVRVIAHIAREHNLPLALDATLTPPCLVKAGSLGAAIAIHSTSKFINGHGTAIGGVLIDTGNYSWRTGRFPEVTQRARRAGHLAFLAHLRNGVHRDAGGCAAPMNSFLMLQGLETLTPRMALHCENALRLAQYLERHPDVAWVRYPGLPNSVYYPRVQAQYGGRAGGVLSFGLGDKARAFRFVDALRLVKNMTNLGDAKTLVLHPASTIFHEYTTEERAAMDVPEDMLRVSVGIEDFEDIRKDFEQAIDAASPSKASALATAPGKEYA
jgi:O-acetylhomoserine (thiol)-lyase